jgi:uncharacterized protein YyaL (SSP411 family)
MLAVAYLEAAQATGEEDFAVTARKVFEYVDRDLTASEGAFYSAEDADSEGEEGKFYLWTEEEIRRHLTAEDADLFCRRYAIQAEGNFVDPLKGGRTGENILHLAEDSSGSASDQDADDPEGRLEASRARLLEIRAARVRPHRDDKILTDWNGLMIAALARGARVLGEFGYADRAARAARFILDRMSDGAGRLWHRYRNGEAAIAGMLDDYAFLIWGLLELYEATFEACWLEEAVRLTGLMLDHFGDETAGGLFFTPADGEELPVRRKEIYDGAVPSGNSVALGNLLRLARFTGDEQYSERAAAMMRAFAGQVGPVPMAHTQFLAGVDFATGPTAEIVIAGDRSSSQTREMLEVLRARYLPRAVRIMRAPDEDGRRVLRLAPYLEHMPPTVAGTLVYVCRDYSCRRPAGDPAELARLLDDLGSA